MNSVLTRRQYLDAMGIQVWRKRQNPDPAAEASPKVAPATEASAAKSSIQRDQPVEKKPEPVSVPVTGGDTPRFRLALLHYVTVGLCVSLDEQVRLPRKLCDDIARHIGGDIDGVRFQEVKWPMLASTGIDQSATAAREVVTQKLKMLPGRVLVLGEEVANYFPPLQGISGPMPGRFGNQDFLLVPGITELTTSAAGKRALMMALQSWR